MKKITAILSICLVAMFMAPALGMSLFGAVALFGALSFMPSGSEGSAAYAGLNKEIWLPEILEGFYADDMFVTEARDLSAFVSNNTINLAEAGANPDVLLNNTTYPIPYSDREDVPIALPLETLDTENTLVQSIEIAELAYDKRNSVMYGHRQALKMFVMERAAFNWAPSTNSALTPLLQTTGTNDGNGRRAMKFADLSRLKRAFNDAEVPEEGRILVLSSKHMEDLENEDRVLYNSLLNTKMIYGFKVYSLASNRLPRYNHTTGAKVAFAAAGAATDSRASIAFHKDEVMRSQGTVDMFIREKDPELRGDMIGFQMRNLTLPMRNKAIAAIYSPAV
jgi:hypothetical protein